MRLINADALDKVKFHPLPYTHITPSDADAESYKRGWNDAIDAIMSEARTIEECKKGKWVLFSPKSHLCSCSLCGQWADRHWNYCPNCGADMRETP